MATNTKSKAMIAALKEALASNIGVKSIEVDGQKLTFNDRADIIAELKYWQTEEAKSTGRRRPFRGVDLRL